MNRFIAMQAVFGKLVGYPVTKLGRLGILVAVSAILGVNLASGALVQLDAANTPSGYLARLLINEAPFPGEKGYVSEDNTRATLNAILWVLHGRIHYIPPGYRQEQVAAVRSADVIDVITAGGEKGQCDGFYRDARGQYVAVPRVDERIRYLQAIANRGKEPGRFSRLMNYAQDLARGYIKEGVSVLDRFENLRKVGPRAVTGRAYGWMTDRSYYNPGGQFVAIPNEKNGMLGGNRFYTLLQLELTP